MSEAEYFFSAKDKESTIYIVMDPLQNDSIRNELPTSKETIATSGENKEFDNQETDIKMFTPHIRKLCANCQKITELVNESVKSERCDTCKRPVAYCCKLCLEISSIREMYAHIFKCHYDDVTSKEMKNSSNSHFFCGKCGVGFMTMLKLRDHELICNDVMFNLFCKFCSCKMRFKREMRDHMIHMHGKQFDMRLLENMLNEIVEEGDAVIKILMEHKGYCKICQKQVPLTPRSTTCITCSNKLTYRCNDSACSSRIYTKLNSLQTHLRYHANKGWTTELRKTNAKRVCR